MMAELRTEPLLTTPCNICGEQSFAVISLAAGQELGWELLGIDPGEEVTAFCRQRGLQVFQGTLAEAPLREKSVDCVTIWNTFDQLPTLASTLAAARRILRPGGLLVVRVPNGEYFRLATTWLRKLPRPADGWLRAALAWNNLLAFPYVYGYSAETLNWLLSRYGFIRAAIYPDTLARRADEQTKTWAMYEERAANSRVPLLPVLPRSCLPTPCDLLLGSTPITVSPYLSSLPGKPHPMSGLLCLHNHKWNEKKTRRMPDSPPCRSTRKDSQPKRHERLESRPLGPVHDRSSFLFSRNRVTHGCPAPPSPFLPCQPPQKPLGVRKRRWSLCPAQNRPRSVPGVAQRSCDRSPARCRA